MASSRLKPLPRDFYARPVLTVARDVIGKLLVHETRQGVLVGRIVEAEAYRGPEDRAAHSYGGRRTERTEVMFGPPGYAYVFFVYGMHWHVNLVTTRAEAPHAVLIRGVEPLEGVELMAKRPPEPSSEMRHTSAPEEALTRTAPTTVPGAEFSGSVSVCVAGATGGVDADATTVIVMVALAAIDGESTLFCAAARALESCFGMRGPGGGRWRLRGGG